MKPSHIILLTTLFFIFFPLSFAQNETTIPTENLGKIHLSYSIVGEITNLNPYSVFVAIPDGQIEIEGSETLPSPNDGIIELTMNKPENVIYYQIKPEKLTKFNKKYGFWLPPYTTAKIKLSVYDYNISLDIEAPTEYKFRVIGPAVSNTYYTIDIKNMFPYASKEHIKLGTFKLYVSGDIETSNSESFSIVLPLPIALKDYDDITIIKDERAPDIWVNYYDWYHNFMNTKHYYLKKELEDDELSSDFDPTISDDDFDDIYFKKEYFPAMAFTVNNGGGKIEFYYIMEWKDRRKKIEFPDII